MDFLSPEILSALLAIVVIDLVLAGDNAIVIALAARSLPPALQKKAIVWGTVGAIVVRAAMTIVVVWLLLIPGLRFLGGLALVWIAYKLLVPKHESKDAHAKPAESFWGAMKTIVIADALMGLDNVLAVAGAAKGSFVLVVIGLLISIPIVVWGSTLILKWVDRFPAFVYVGAGVLALTAAQMMLHEPMLGPYLEGRALLKAAVYVVVIAGVLLAGFLASRRRLAAVTPSGDL
ncbi:MAG TPA: TerC family protein [Burkholderiales bacterium]|nr:TerC family protein [Burkholderiales bacterium]